MHTSLKDCIKEIEIENVALDELKKQHARAIHEKDKYLRELQRQKELLLEGLDMKKLNLAENLLSIKMHQDLAGDDIECINEVISELVNNSGKRLFKEHNSTKNYDGWYHQGCGWIEYGCCPRHGFIVFSIGINKAMRENPRDLTPEEIEAGTYLLEMLKAGKWSNEAKKI